MSASPQKTSRKKVQTHWISPHHERIGGQNYDRFLIGRPLTDRAIEKYAVAGRYSNGKATRREIADMRRQMKESRDGNFVNRDGRMIYSPI